MHTAWVIDEIERAERYSGLEQHIPSDTGALHVGEETFSGGLRLLSIHTQTMYTVVATLSPAVTFFSFPLPSSIT